MKKIGVRLSPLQVGVELLKGVLVCLLMGVLGFALVRYGVNDWTQLEYLRQHGLHLQAHIIEVEPGRGRRGVHYTYTVPGVDGPQTYDVWERAGISEWGMFGQSSVGIYVDPADPQIS